tara:strand:+ start:43 stop:276 length:234 start_codon:yes stop_codon:yes gene_type:complete
MTKKALISPSEIRYGNESQTQSGYRIAQITDTEFAVGGNLFWIDCPDNTTTRHYYDPDDSGLKIIYVKPLSEIEGGG